MNNNELLKGLYDLIKTSGWLDEATKYFQEHPEKYHDCVNSSGKIAGLTMSVSYQPKSLSAVAEAKPIVFISIGNYGTDAREYNVYDTGIIQSRTWIDSKPVVEVYNNAGSYSTY